MEGESDERVSQQQIRTMRICSGAASDAPASKASSGCEPPSRPDDDESNDRSVQRRCDGDFDEMGAEAGRKSFERKRRPEDGFAHERDDRDEHGKN